MSMAATFFVGPYFRPEVDDNRMVGIELKGLIHHPNLFLVFQGLRFTTELCCAEYPSSDVTTTTGESVSRSGTATSAPAFFIAQP